MSALGAKQTYAALAAIQAADAVACVKPIAPIKKTFDDVGLPEELRPLIPVVKAASAVGLLSVFRWLLLADHHLHADGLLRAEAGSHVRGRDWSLG